MTGLFGALLLPYLAAGAIGFALGWGIRRTSYSILASGIERDIAELRRRLAEARERRARES